MSGTQGGVLRRHVVFGAAACCLIASRSPSAEAEEADLPQKGDQLVIDTGPNEGKIANIENVTVTAGLVSVVPLDPQTGMQRTASRFSKILLLRFAPEDIQADYSAYSADGVVALSAICTHQGCTINAWNPENKHLSCFCHHSEFLPAEGGTVAHGPARKRLPVIPITKEDNGSLIVAGGFLGKPGPGPV